MTDMLLSCDQFHVGRRTFGDKQKAWRCPPSDRMIDVFVSRLRKKIEQDPKRPQFIVTVPGHGYKFAAMA